MPSFVLADFLDASLLYLLANPFVYALLVAAGFLVCALCVIKIAEIADASAQKAARERAMWDALHADLDEQKARKIHRLIRGGKGAA